MRLFYMILFLQCIYIGGAKAELLKEQAKTAKITVVLAEGYGLDSIFTSYTPYGFRDFPGMEKIIAVKENNNTNTYSIEFKHNEPVVYFNLNRRIKNGNLIKLIDNYAIEPNSHVTVHVSADDRLTFTGSGSVAMQCVYEIQNAIEHFNNAQLLVRSAEIKRKTGSFQPELNDDYYLQWMPWWIGISNQKKQIIANSLVNYKDRISGFMYHLTEANLMGALETVHLIVFNRVMTDIKQAKTQNVEALRNKLLILNNDIPIFDYTKIPDSSLTYSSGVAEFIVRAWQYGKRTDLETLIKNYHGEFKDRLIVEYIQTCKNTSWFDPENWQKAQGMVSMVYCKELIHNTAENLSVGKKVFPFSLPDTSGKIIKLENLKGKVVLLDFFFTGCPACRELNKNMAGIYQRYEDNSNIVFISISVDKDRNKWKKSIREQIYTHKGSIDLYTEGKGSYHSIISRYAIFGYPTMLLIDKQGRLAAVNPPRPSNQAREQELINLIEKQLERK